MANNRPTPERRGSYLTPSLRDEDTGSIHSEQDSDSEDDSVIRQARTSEDVRAHDRNILEEEEERDRMLTAARQPGRAERRGSGGIRSGIVDKFRRFGGGGREEMYGRVAQGSSEDVGSGSGEGKREARRRRREEKRERLMAAAQQGEDRGLLYEMEDGEMKQGSETGDSSDTEGLEPTEKAHLHDDEYTQRTRWGVKTWIYITILILLFITLLVLGAWRLSLASRSRRPKHNFEPPRTGYMSNGTALFRPTTLLLSLDGFRASYLDRGVTPNLAKFMSEGVAPQYMLPSFPSVTFPNHYTLITGLYPESHGIVANKFWDPALGKEFHYTDPSKSRAREWWSQAEPLWVTAERAGVRTAVHMWPGSEAAISDTVPSYVDGYNGKQPLDVKLGRMFDMLDMPGAEDESLPVEEQRPQFVVSYVPNIDAVGHKFGPNSTEVTESLQKVDAMLGDLFKGIEERNLTEIVNIVIVSDHGMAESSNDRLIQMDKIIDMNLVEHVDGWPLYGIRPKEPVANNLLKLHKVLMMSAVEYRHVFDVYTTDKDMPERWHFTKNERIAPLWVVPKAGWAIVTKEEFDVEEAKISGKQYTPKGIHGYDHEHEDMRAIFAARGPAFREVVGKKVEPFQNIQVYNILCDSLYLTPRPNNGTLNFFRQPAALPAPAPSPGISSLSGSAAVSSAVSSLSSALSSASTEVAASSTAIPENPLKKPGVSISPAPEQATNAPERPVISVTPAVVASPSASPSVIAAVPDARPSASPAAGSEADVADEPDAVIEPEGPEEPDQADAVNGAEDGEEEDTGPVGWWDFIKGKIGEAKDWVSGILPGGS